MTSPVHGSEHLQLATQHCPPRWAITVGRLLLGTLLASNVLVAHAQTQAALPRMPIADPNAPLQFRPSVSTLSSGAALVNITAPNAAGMSLNQYQRFDVGNAGVVLNNSQAGGTALSGGGVGGNPNLTAGTASTIVNEVTVQGAPSLLSGTIEVFGAPAAVIVANPSGVTCAGCGVANTPRLTFATGTPKLQAADGSAATWANASRIGWDIQGGQIRILDNGIEGTVGRLDLLGQSLFIDGPLRAHYLNQDLSSINLAAGTQGFSLQADGNWGPGPSAIPGATIAPATGIAIDATVLGAMTAGQIRIVSTDAGFGVNLRGALNAFQQGIQANSNGSLSLGQASAVQGIQLSANGHLTTGNLNAGTTLDAASTGSMTLGTSTKAGRDINLNAGGDLNTGASLATPGNFSATAKGNLHLGERNGQTSIGGSANVKGGGVAQQGKLDVGVDLIIQAGSDAHLAGETHAARDVQMQAGGTATLSGALTAGNDAAISATNIDIPGTLQIARDANVSAGKRLSLTGSATVGNELNLSGDTLDISGKIVARNTAVIGDCIVLGAGASAADINGGLALKMQKSIEVNGPLHVTGNAVFTSGTDTTLNGPVDVSGAFAVNAGGNATVGAGGVTAGSVQMNGSNVSVGGDILSATTVSLAGANAVTVNGQLAGGGDVSATSGGAMQIAGSVVSGGNVAVSGSTVGVTGQVNALGAANLNATSGALAIQGGGVSAGGDVTLGGTQVNVAGSIQTLGAAGITGRTGDVHIQGDVVANKALTLTSAGAATINGKAASGGATTMTAQGPLTINGELASSGATTLQSGGNLGIAGPLRSGGNLHAHAAGTVHVQGPGLVLGDASITGAGAQTWGGPLTATGKLQASNAAGDFTVAGAIGANGAVTLSSGGSISANALASGGQASVNAANDIAIAGATQVQGGSFKSTQGAVRIDGNLDSLQALNLQAQTDVKLAGKTTVGGDLSASATSGTVQFAQDLAVGGNLNAKAGQDLLLQGATSRVIGSATLQADTGKTLNQGVMTVGNGLAVQQTGDFINEATVQVNGDIAISARNIRSNLTTAGGIAATGQLALAASRRAELGAQGVVTAKGDTTIAAAQGMTQAGSLSSGGKLDYSGAAVTNSGKIAASAVTVSAELTNSGSVWGDSDFSARDITNAAGASIGSAGALRFDTLRNDGIVSGASIAAGLTFNGGSIVSAGDIGIVGGLANTGTVSAKGDLAAVGGGEIFNSGQIDGNNVLLGATRHTNVGVIQSAGTMHIYGGPMANEAAGQINAGSTLKIDINGTQAAQSADGSYEGKTAAQWQQESADWGEGGTKRVAAHTALGALTGGASGAAGALASQVSVNTLGTLVADTDLPLPVKQALITSVSMLVGGAAGGTQGATAAGNATVNNYLSATDIRSKNQKVAACREANDGACEVKVLREYDDKSAKNSASINYGSVLTKSELESEKGGLEKLIADPSCSAACKAEAAKSVNEINVAINVINKTPVIANAAELAGMGLDLAGLGAFAGGRALTSAVVREYFASKGVTIADDAAGALARSAAGANGGGKLAGEIKILQGATPDANELRAGQGLAEQFGYDVAHQPTASQLGVQGQRTADLTVKGVGQVDVYTPTSTNPTSITRAIEGKNTQATAVLVQTSIGDADMATVAARTWGKPTAQNIQTIFFQKPDGSIVRFNRPTGG